MKKILTLLLLPLIVLAGCNTTNNDKTFAIAEYIQQTKNYLFQGAYLFHNASEIDNDIFTIPNNNDPDTYFTNNNLLYINITIASVEDDFCPASLNIVDNKLEIVFNYSLSDRLTEALHDTGFGITIPKSFPIDNFTQIKVKAYDTIRNVFGSNFIEEDGVIEEIKIGFNMLNNDESFAITEYIQRSEYYFFNGAYLFHSISEINNDFFIIPNDSDPDAYFTNNNLFYITITIAGVEDDFCPVSLNIINNELEIVFNYSLSNRLTEDLYNVIFGITISKSFSIDDFTQIRVMAYDTNRNVFGSHFIQQEGVMKEIKIGFNMLNNDESFAITEYIQQSEHNLFQEAYLFHNASEIENDFFVIPNDNDPDTYFTNNNLLYIDIDAEGREEDFCPVSLNIIDNELEIVFNYWRSNRLTLDLYSVGFGVTIPKSFPIDNFEQIRVRAYDTIRNVFGSHFIKQEGKIVIIK
ncbi:MAG: hypothetical protein LBM99_00080 [Bacillales bacterium]|jgi:hypothetical protein|nr:hypothetical protein [Bacillales bacterium]